MNDSQLRNAFQQLRDAEAASAPRFGVARRARPAVRRFVFVAAAIVLAVVLSVRRERPVAPSIVTWKPATDVLLRTPGDELLTTLPRIPDVPERK